MRNYHQIKLQRLLIALNSHWEDLLGKPENTVETYLHDEIVKLGGTTRKWVSPGRKYVPDRIVVLHGEIWFVEVKTLNEKPSDGQEREAERLRRHGANVTSVSGKKGVDEFITRMMA